MKNDLPLKTRIYLRAAELIEMGGLARGTLCVTPSGKPTLLCDAHLGDGFCYHGAIMKAMDELTGYFPVDDAFDNAVWNDAPDTTKEMVVARLREEAFKEESHDR